MARYFDIINVPVNTTEWMPIKPTIACHRIVIENPGAGTLWVRIDENGPAKRILPDGELDIDSVGECFQVGQPVCQVRATVDTVVVVTCTK